MGVPTFSIVIPVYRVERYLETCVESVIKQTYRDIEIILVDDGSPDACPQICDGLKAKDSRIRVVHKENGGLSSARNAGLSIATGMYVLFLDSDDFWIGEEGLADINKQLIETNADILIFGMKKYYESRQSDSKEILGETPACDKVYLSHAHAATEIMNTNTFVACACDKVVRREIIEKNHLSFVERQLSEDIEWCCKLLLCDPLMTVYNRTFYAYRQENTDSITHNIGRKNLEHICEVIDKYVSISENNMPETIFLLNFLAEQYVLWLTVSNLVDKRDISDLLRRMKKHWSLVRFHKYPHVRRVYQMRWLGFEHVRKLLGMYKKIMH